MSDIEYWTEKINYFESNCRNKQTMGAYVSTSFSFWTSFDRHQFSQTPSLSSVGPIASDAYRRLPVVAAPNKWARRFSGNEDRCKACGYLMRKVRFPISSNETIMTCSKIWLSPPEHPLRPSRALFLASQFVANSAPSSPSNSSTSPRRTFYGNPRN